MLNVFFYDTDIGKIGISKDSGKIKNLFFSGTVAPKEYIVAETAPIKKAAGELFEYLAGKRRCFDLPLDPDGTDFEKKVWSALLEIPFGETRNYGEIADSIGRHGASRAVGRANSKNPISIFIPCHRVVGKKGDLTGYAGGLPLKKALLELESK